MTTENNIPDQQDGSVPAKRDIRAEYREAAKNGPIVITPTPAMQSSLGGSGGVPAENHAKIADGNVPKDKEPF
jgi:hypothetical protein